MAYVISITAATAEEAAAQLEAEFAAVAAAAAEHSHAQDVVLASAKALLQKLRAPAKGERIAVELRGSVAGDPFAGCSHIGAYVSVTVGALVETN